MRLFAVLLCACAHTPPPAPPFEVSDEARVWFARATLAATRGDAAERDRSIAWLEGIDPSARAPLAVARMLWEAGQPDAARAAWSRAHARDPDEPAVRALADELGLTP